MTNTDGSEKSSRSKADYFELLIAQSLVNHFQTDDDFSRDISELESFLGRFVDGEKRVAEQQKRAQEIMPKIVTLLEVESIQPVRVEWIGRKHQTERSLSDVDLILANGEKIGISLKSVRVGDGTQKNIGLATTKKYLGIEIDRDIEAMWASIRADLKSGGMAEVSEQNMTRIKAQKRRYPIITELGKKYGNIVQLKANVDSVEHFNQLSPEKKVEFLKCILGMEDTRRVLNVVCNEGDTDKIYWNQIFEDRVAATVSIEARVQGDMSYMVLLDGEPIFRVQSSFTNGIGVSAFCQRAFLY